MIFTASICISFPLTALADGSISELASILMDEQSEWCTEHPKGEASADMQEQQDPDGYTIINGGIEDVNWFISVINNQYSEWRTNLGFWFADCELTEEQMKNNVRLAIGAGTFEQEMNFLMSEAQAAGNGSCKDSALCFYLMMEMMVPGAAKKRSGEGSDKKGHAFIEVNEGGETYYVDPVNSLLIKKN